MKSSLPDQPSIELYIEELVLHGLSSSSPYVLAEAVQQELVRLFAHQGISPAAPNELGAIDAGEFAVEPGARSEGIGAKVAKSVYRRLRTDPLLNHCAQDEPTNR